MIASGWLPSLPCSVEQLDWRERVDGGDGLLVDDLRLTISREQNAEAIEGGHVALELASVLEEHGHRNLMVLKVPEKHLLDSLDPLYSHLESPSLLLITAETLGGYCKSSSSFTKPP